MKYLLIALYLPNGSLEPHMETSLLPDKLACQSAQEQYLKSQAAGSKWAICKKLKPFPKDIPQ